MVGKPNNFKSFASK